MNWKLPAPAVAAAATPAAPAPRLAATPAPAPVRLVQADPSEKLICRRRLRVGSLADFERTCLTRADWDRLGDRMREGVREMAEKGHTNLRQEACQTGNMSAGC